MTVHRKQLAERARAHLNEPAPKNTCVSLGMNKWPQELGLPGIGTNSVSDAKVRAMAGHAGWEYHEGLDGVQVGDFVDWVPEVLGDPRDRHVSCVIEIDNTGSVKTIGAGGPTGKVYWQPKSGGFNSPDYFRGYFRVPVGSSSSSKPADTSPNTTAIKQQASGKAEKYTVKRGDYLLRVAARNDTTVGRIVKLNRLRNPDHIEVGQVLKLR